MYIGVAGNIGAGKTTLANMLSKHYGVPLLEECVAQNPYLDRYYEDMHKWSFHTQMFFVISRVKTFMDNQAKFSSGILDRILDEDKHIFAQHLREKDLLSEDEFAMYDDFFSLQTAQVKPLDVLIYIKSDVARLKENILKRNRSYELDLIRPENTYLAELNTLYESWISGYVNSPVIILDANKDNVIREKEKRKKLIEQINAHL